MSAPSPTASLILAPRRRAVHGVRIGILVLDTKFQRLPGDVGNGTSWPFPVQYAVVHGATPDRIVRPTLDDDVFQLFARAADDLVALGVDGITTSCGFLALLHPQMVAHCPVPVATSALLQIPLVQSMLPAGKRVGVVTMDKASLTPAHFRAVGAPTDLPIVGIPPDGIFRRNQQTSAAVVSHAEHEAEVVAAAAALLRDHPEVGALVLECTNLPPYSATLEATFNLPVYDIVTLVEWFHAGLRPRRFNGA
ncbi:hypothetical protein C8P66_1438 [Humitalea rosea]|uniref:Aspartate/glutamate racemase family protein n=1 Tax=Humitalea rosea TaxID=990373 RepID=A0A2W7HVX1_9PROT|nr:aspartate/glutamate racemase family protein [Humitalea rosea]PZW37684.1 hypothetical protein C8P66_1438 [Humitalea rosea]